ncbi:MAG: glycosyltransferase family 39 protein, partial [Anaerolineae bacterium]|nr:glycosyltransferase family 39 protein [Anaerolineae bacterium]
FDMVHYDEAYYGVDALSLVTQPRLTPFFPENFGRESLWMYLLAPSLAIFGGSAFALRIAAFFTGVLTVAAVFRLGRELFGARVGVWAAAALSVLLWAVLAGHQAFRAHVYPLAGALAFALLWRAWRQSARKRPSLKPWIWVGLAFGALAYTYIAARAWLVLAVVWVIALGLSGVGRTRLRRRGALLAGMIALMIALPMIGYLAANPQLAGQRSEQVIIGSLDELSANVVAWVRALFAEGSRDVAYNLPGRPVLDAPLLILTAIGAFVLTWYVWRRRDLRRQAIFIVLLAAASLAPALLTTDALKPLRAVGLIVPLALVVGLGAAQLETAARVQFPAAGGVRRWATLIPLALLAWAGANTATDFAVWVRSPDLFLPMEQHIYRGIDTLAARTPPDAPVYFSPFTPAHPVLRLRQWTLAPRPVSAFERADCLRLPDAPEAYYFALTFFDPDFAQALAPWATVEALDWTAREDAGRYTIYRVQPDRQLFTEAGLLFADRLAVSVSGTLPDAARQGDTIPLDLLVRARAPLDRDYTLFVHLYGDPTPYAGGDLWAQTDVPLCPSSPPPTWRTDEIIVETAALSIPPDLPPGDYQIAIGIYETGSHERLGVSTPASGLDYAVVHNVTVP